MKYKKKVIKRKKLFNNFNEATKALATENPYDLFIKIFDFPSTIIIDEYKIKILILSTGYVSPLKAVSAKKYLNA